MPDEIVLYGVDDVLPERESPGSIFDHVRDALRAGDIAFCHLEQVLSNRGTVVPQAKVALRGSPSLARAIKEAGFDVVSFAGNHCLGLGRDAFLDTIDALRDQRLSVIGVGANIAEARKPAFVECKGTYINKRAEPEVLAPNDRRFGEVVDYMERISADQGLETKYSVRGDEVIIGE